MALLALRGLTTQAATAADPNSHPNIIFVCTDDLGWGDLGCYSAVDWCRTQP